MDFVWLAAVAVLWVVMAEMVVGLNRLAAPKSRGEETVRAQAQSGVRS